MHRVGPSWNPPASASHVDTGGFRDPKTAPREKPETLASDTPEAS